MKRIYIGSIILVLVTLLATASGSSRAERFQQATPSTPLGSGFTYQGQLKDSAGNPIDDSCDFRFILYDVEVGGTQIGPTQEKTGVNVVKGYFTVLLDFGSAAFSGEARWLDTSVSCANDADYTVLTPRQLLTATPYAMHSSSASTSPWSGLIGVPAGFADGIDNDTTSFWSLTGNAGTDPDNNFIGTTDSISLTFVVSGAPALQIEPNQIAPNLIGGYSQNWITPGVYGATLFGGGDIESGYGKGFNGISDAFGTVGGGISNRAGDNAGSVEDSMYATVGGGFHNTANGGESTVSGGQANTAWGIYSTVGGGLANTASGYGSTIPGGLSNSAEGQYSFAAGVGAQAYSQGCFVWGDFSTSAYLYCQYDNRWIARASGGVYFYTNSGLSSGMYLASGGSAWNAVSNPALKDHFAAIDTQALVKNLASIPITTWNYKAQDASIRHVGPMANDFNALLPGLGGEGEMSINSLDVDGIALASIQGLYQMLQEKEAHLSQVETSLAEQQRVVKDLQAETGTLRLQVEALKLSRTIASSGVFSPSTLFSALACLLAGAAYLRTRKHSLP